jgi:phosphatidylinositol-4,5-bisphosphate 3-kinase
MSHISLHQSEIHVPEISERYSLLLEAYLRGCGSHRNDLMKQITLLDFLAQAANFIKPLRDKDGLRDTLVNRLRQFNFPSAIQLPLNPSYEQAAVSFSKLTILLRIYATGLVLEKCKHMDSKKVKICKSVFPSFFLLLVEEKLMKQTTK